MHPSGAAALCCGPSAVGAAQSPECAAVSFLEGGWLRERPVSGSLARGGSVSCGSGCCTASTMMKGNGFSLAGGELPGISATKKIQIPVKNRI